MSQMEDIVLCVHVHVRYRLLTMQLPHASCLLLSPLPTFYSLVSVRVLAIRQKFT